MARAIQDNTATATARRIFLLIYADPFTGAGWAGSVTGVKAQLSVNGGAETASTNDVVRVGGALHYVELTQAEADRAAGDRIHARVAAASGRLEAIGAADIFADDVYSAALTAPVIAGAVRDELLSLREGAQTQPAGGSTQTLSIVDQPGGTTLGVVRVYRDSAGRVVGRTELTPT